MVLVKPTGIRLTGNPGGPGHQWVRARYIDPAPLGWRLIKSREGLERIFIPSRVGDNRYLGPDYVQRLRASGARNSFARGSKATGALSAEHSFPSSSMDRHVIPPCSLPAHWAPRFRSCSTGGVPEPFACHWWARTLDGSITGLARGALVNYREWYGR